MHINLSGKIVVLSDIYTPEDLLLSNIPKPEKEPYLILRISFSNNNLENNYTYHILQKFGYGNISTFGHNFLLTVTGKRNIKEVIGKLLTDNKEKHYFSSNEKDEDIISFLKKFDNKIRLPNINPPPQRRVPSNHIVFNDDVVWDNSRTQPVTKVTYNGKSYIYKKDETGRQNSEIEAFNSMCYRLLLGTQTPVTYSVHDSDTNRRLGIISEEIENFEPLFNKKRGMIKGLTAEALNKGGLGKLCAAAYSEEENDFSCTNIGFDSHGQLHKIDHGQSSFPITSEYSGSHPKAFDPMLVGAAPVDSFPITNKDINELPYPTDAKFNRFLFNYFDDPNLGTINTEAFTDDKFYTLLIRSLIGDSVYKNFAELSFRKENSKIKNSEHKIKRTKELKENLLNNVQFIEFLLQNKDSLWDKIKAHFEKYNQISGENEQVNLQDIEEGFEHLKIELSPEKTLEKFKTKIESTGYLNERQKNSATALQIILDASLDNEKEKNKIPIIVNQSCKLMDSYESTVSRIKSKPAKYSEYVKKFAEECITYEKTFIQLSPKKKAFIAVCTFAGALLGAALGLVLGATAGLAAGASLGGGVGSVVPVLGTVVGAIKGGSIGGVIGAIKLAGIGSMIGSAVFAAAGAALIGILGGKAGYLSRYGMFNTQQKAIRNFSKELQKGIEVIEEPKPKEGVVNYFSKGFF